MVLLFNLSTDFILGSISAVAAYAIYYLYSLFQAPPVDKIEKISSTPLPHLGDDNDGVTIWGMDAPGKCRSEKFGVADASPYVSRVEGYLRLCKIDYVKKGSMGGSENPRNKAPFANIKGTMVDDSDRIIDTIKNTFMNETKVIDVNLTQEQVRTGFLIRRLLHGSLYWVELHQMFNTDDGRTAFSEEMSHNLPPIISTLVSKMVFRKMHKNLYGSGIGRYPHADIVKRGEEDVRCLSQILGKTNKYILGTDEPTSYDVDVYTWLVLLFNDKPQIANPWVVDIQKECINLVAYVNRLRGILFPELKEEK